ncbi:MAG TPA: ATPase, T2SS/T4P/T4SS family [Acidimicrobiales bacterium]|nr:ATPase, T2SS/T4P/T4SS family [Acidimicrobiales bacterium]
MVKSADGATVRMTTRTRLGELLVARDLVTEDQLAEALAEQQRSGGRLGRVLVAIGAVNEVDLVRTLAEHYGIDFVDLEEEPIDANVAQILREPFARRRQALPIGWDSERLVVAMANPSDVFAIDDVRSLTGFEIKPVMAEETQLQEAFARVWSAGHKAEAILAGQQEEEDAAGAGQGAEADVRIHGEDDEAHAAPVVKFVNHLIARAVQERASDIHLEPTESQLRIRFRIDGVLHDVMTVPRAMRASVLSRIKIMGDIDIAERRIPQDGRISVRAADRVVDLRAITLPTAEGEAIVLRILDKESGLVAIEDLGFLPESLARYTASFRRPWGAILVTGPTGSGKSTTLYATLNELNRPQLNIITIEDPIEYRVVGIKQMQVNRKAGLTFASALRSVLRADPDIVLVGEIRDQETARIAAEAALTGHLVLSTLHTNDAASTPMRLIEMGVEPFMVTSSIDCVLAQRLARRLCDSCKEPYSAAREELRPEIWGELELDEEPTFFRAVGCRACNRTGYRGRFAIHEVMPVTEELSRMIVARASAGEVKLAAIEQGMLTLAQDGLRKAAVGQTSLEELYRVIAL